MFRLLSFLVYENPLFFWLRPELFTVLLFFHQNVKTACILQGCKYLFSLLLHCLCSRFRHEIFIQHRFCLCQRIRFLIVVGYITFQSAGCLSCPSLCGAPWRARLPPKFLSRLASAILPKYLSTRQHRQLSDRCIFLPVNNCFVVNVHLAGSYHFF